MKSHSKSYFRQLLKAKVAAAKARGRTYKPPRMRKPPRPLNIQREYTKELHGMVEYLHKLYEEDVYPRLPAIVAKAQAHKKDSLDWRVLKKDTYADDVDHTMNHVQIRFQQKYSKPVKSSIARIIGNKINQFSKGVFENQVNTLVGTNVFVSEPWLEEKMSAFVKENVDLISKWSDGLKSQAEEIIMRGARTGTNPEDIASELNQRINVVGSRYDMIARDQVSKFNGQLSQIRHEDLGINQYTWDTSHDERVRETHAELDGEVFSYDDPPVTNDEGDTNNPGQDYNCVPEDESVQIFSPTKKAFRRWFTGELATIITESNPPLRLTKNHPVLTLRGWLPAHLFKVGDYLVKATFENTNRFIAYPKGGNTTAKEIFSSFQKVGLSQRVAGRAAWFHGDAIGEDINVVVVKRPLLLDRMTSRFQKFGNNFFPLSHSSASGKRKFPIGGVSSRNSADGVMSFSNLGISLRRIQARPFEKLGFTLRSNVNVISSENPSDWSPADIEMFSDSVLAKAILIHPDYFNFREVKGVGVQEWSGWVHNFETVTGWFSSSNLIIHNCRCADIPYIDDTIGELSDEIDEEDQDEFDAEQEGDVEEEAA